MSAGRSSSTSDLERDALSAGRRVGDADRAGVSRLTSAQHWPVGCTPGGQEESPMILCATDLSPSAETAGEVAARFITMGTHGRKGAARLFLGSVAERVSAGARCPVIVASEATAGASHWPATRRLNLAVATDGSPLGQAALEWAGEIRGMIPCDVTVVRIYSP